MQRSQARLSWLGIILFGLALCACGGNASGGQAARTPTTVTDSATSVAIDKATATPLASTTPILNPTVPSQVGGSGAPPTVTAQPQATPMPTDRRVTAADNNTTIEMHIGESILVYLGEELKWSVTVANDAVLGRAPNVQVISGAQGRYRANSIGETTLTAIGKPTCADTPTPCPAFSVFFRVDVHVAP